MHDRRLRPRRRNVAALFCLLMIGVAVATTFAMARLHEASFPDVDTPVIATFTR